MGQGSMDPPMHSPMASAASSSAFSLSLVSSPRSFFSISICRQAGRRAGGQVSRRAGGRAGSRQKGTLSTRRQPTQRPRSQLP